MEAASHSEAGGLDMAPEAAFARGLRRAADARIDHEVSQLSAEARQQENQQAAFRGVPDLELFFERGQIRIPEDERPAPPTLHNAFEKLARFKLGGHAWVETVSPVSHRHLQIAEDNGTLTVMDAVRSDDVKRGVRLRAGRETAFHLWEIHLSEERVGDDFAPSLAGRAGPEARELDLLSLTKTLAESTVVRAE